MTEAIVALVTAVITALISWWNNKSERAQHKAELADRDRTLLVLRKLNESLRVKENREKQEEKNEVDNANNAVTVGELLRRATRPGGTKPPGV